MDIHKHDQLLGLIEEHYAKGQIQAQFTQWDSDSEDEEVTQLQGTLASWKLTDNEFGEKDLLIVLESDTEGTVEILMEIPADEDNLAVFAEGRLSIFGTEAELILSK
ncbi:MULTISPECIES: hypothetical protein [Brevibacillus]|jgi:hypothetical protein|uniref:Uncharacterized protein n=1 Tax=Brevibacillus borstelensis AK1 TaxID=1300222 RepID=M8DK99_9BACL|nr:hypothetical protein [Brevibacillus borstelensis]EMT53887.1 hypothetical protein I532_07725 [Brevibacillus borstelensis AK1]KKX56714.1 hypothetical protein X546_01715 [Brevibacillus borstelensis cifa_chp40]MBE5395596.1 hypothetical protein [Brevibacillus borstelensis]MCC0565277.1 hypothetical protein [Brevibacillus borstelensis]MCM3470868.1 hypothetical protein [Brevibacillus borstelensis]